MSKITKYLNQVITGNVFDAPEILDKYSTDRSILEFKPELVALPESTEDLQKLMKFFYQLAEKGTKYQIAIRGSGLDELGADLSSGIIISTEKLNHLKEISAKERLVHVQAGITLKELNTALLTNGLTLPINANGNETIGGLIANCTTDSYSEKYGGIMNYIERAEIVLSNGERIQTDRYGAHTVTKKISQKNLEGKIYRTLRDLAKNQPKELGAIANTKALAGYSNVSYALKKDTINLLPLMFASEGTLGIISEVILRVIPLPPAPTRMIVSFSKLEDAELLFKNSLATKPCEINIFDRVILDAAEKYGKKLSAITNKNDDKYVAMLSFDYSRSKALKKIRKCLATFKKTPRNIIENDENRNIFDELSNTLISYLNLPNKAECPPLLTNFYVPHENFAAFLKEKEEIEAKIKLSLPLYGSYSASNYSIRPEFDLTNEEDRKKAILFFRVGALLVQKNHGLVTGGSPEGRTKALVLKNEIDPAHKEIYAKIKLAFDPQCILNPNAKLGISNKTTLNHIRTSNSAKIVL